MSLDCFADAHANADDAGGDADADYFEADGDDQNDANFNADNVLLQMLMPIMIMMITMMLVMMLMLIMPIG